MAITKTNFIEYTRCQRFSALENIKKEHLNSKMTLSEYELEENDYKKQIMLSQMFKEIDGEEIDLTDQYDETLEAMMPYYKQVEIEAARIVSKIFSGKTKHALKTKQQESFDYNHNGIRYLCYVDIINEVEDSINIIEVKASTSSSFYNIGPSKSDVVTPIFAHHQGIEYLLEDLNVDIDAYMNLDKYENNRNKLFKRYGEGKYVYDLAVQRMIIEGEYKETKQEHKIKKTNYYLAVLNHEYIFPGTYENGKPVYETDEFGNEIIKIFDLTKITEEYQKIILENQKELENYLFNPNSKPVKLGTHCQVSGLRCKYFDLVCTNMLPDKNSVMNFAGNISFEDEKGTKYKNKLDLINEGYFNMIDIPSNWIKNINHLIQKDVVENKFVYIHQDKIKAALKSLKYPLYHLDFETFPCPLPRFKGETCYEQSPFEFSLHIEHSPGECDFNKDNYVYLNKTHNDERHIIAKKLVELIDPDQGMMFAQNYGFEKKVLRKLGVNFPEYKEHLNKIAENSFDLLHIVKNNQDLYKSLGFTEEDLKINNYYHEDLQGSYSIKKTLPVFTDLSYNDLEIKNGNQAYVTYLKYPHYSEEEYKIKYDALVKYCKQDTWAMYKIKEKIRELVE